MSIVDPTTLQRGQVIRFKSIAVHDNVYWTGKITGIVNYELARTIADVDTYYLDVKKYNSSIKAKESLTYLVLQVAENETTSTTRVFAIEWIDTASLTIVDENTTTTIVVYDISDNTAKELLKTIQGMGYTAEIKS